MKSQHRRFCAARIACFRALPSYDKRPSLWERYISVRQRTEDLFPLLSSLSFTSTSCPYFSKMAHQLLWEQTFPPCMLITRSGCFTSRRICLSHKSSFGSRCYSDPRLRSLPSAQTSTWQRFGIVLALTRPRCLRLSCELSAGSTGSSLLFLALSECWLSALLFCLLSLRFYHVGKFFCARPRPLTARRTTLSPQGPVTHCSAVVGKCSYDKGSDKLLSRCGVKNARDRFSLIETHVLVLS